MTENSGRMLRCGLEVLGVVSEEGREEGREGEGGTAGSRTRLYTARKRYTMNWFSMKIRLRNLKIGIITHINGSESIMRRKRRNTSLPSAILGETALADATEILESDSEWPWRTKELSYWSGSKSVTCELKCKASWWGTTLARVSRNWWHVSCTHNVDMCAFYISTSFL